MKRFYHVPFITILISFLLVSSSSNADTVNGYYGYAATSGLEEIYGQYVNAESYSRLDTQEDYDPGYLEDWGGWHLRSETEVQNSKGTVTADSQTTAPIGAWVGMGRATLDLNESAEALAWTNTQSFYSPDIDRTVDIYLYRDTDLNLPEGLTGSVNYYFGIWENDLIVDNFMLAEKDGWSLSELDFKGQTYSLLRQTHILGDNLAPDTTEWSLDLEVGNNYNFFAYMVAETVVPEPTTIALLALGGLFLRHRK